MLTRILRANSLPPRQRCFALLTLLAVLSVTVAAFLYAKNAVAAALALCLPLPSLAALLGLALTARNEKALVPMLLPAGLALNLIGVATLAVTAPSFCMQQCFWSVLAIGIFFVVMHSEAAHLLARMRLPLYLTAVVLMILTYFIGTNPSGEGQHLWLAVGSRYFQPSELLKLGMVVFLASQPLMQWRANRKIILQSLAVIGISIVLPLGQGDLGAAFVITAAGVLLLLGATGRWQELAVGMMVLLAAAFTVYNINPRAQARFDTWLDPWKDPYGTSYQVVQSLRAVTAGGIFGRGILAEKTVHVPASHTDFILSAISERFGLMGGLLLLALFVVLLWRITQQDEGAGSESRSLLCLGLGVLLVGQMILIIGGNLAVLPLTGVTLPFVSYGGSSLLVSYLSLALLDKGANGASNADWPGRAFAVRWHRVVYWGLAVGIAVLGLALCLWGIGGEWLLAHKLSVG